MSSTINQDPSRARLVAEAGSLPIAPSIPHLTPLTAPLPALPLDIARILIGGVLFVYFVNALRQTRDFTDPDGLIDHRLVARLLPPTRIGLFQPGMPGVLLRAVHLAACAASLLVVAGHHPRAAAAFLFLAAVSTYRWNVLVAYLDDAMIHIFCLWLVLLPVGGTLTLPSVLERGWSAAAADWLSATAPGAAPRLFLANMALVYLVAGAYKFASPMWRDGSAMHAALRMPIARAPGFWTPSWRAPLRLVTRAALVLEPLFALVFVLPDGSLLKWALLAGAVAFHLGIALTLKIPYSNAIMLAALAIPFGPEIMGGLGAEGAAAPGLVPPEGAAAGIAPLEAVAVALVALIAVNLVWEAANTGLRLRERYSSTGWDNPARALLWAVGIFQSYRLFDWVDERNYHVRFEVTAIADDGDPTDLDPDALFPRSMRHLLLQSYLVGNIWLRMSPDRLRAVRRSLLERHARRYARTHPDAGTIEVVAIVQRVTRVNLDLTRDERRPLMRFTCRGGEAVMDSPEPSWPRGAASPAEIPVAGGEVGQEEG